MQEQKLVLKLRLDYRSRKQRMGLLFGAKNGERLAEATREQRAAYLRNVPLQGIVIRELDQSLPVYAVYDELTGQEVTYAPMEVTLEADSIEDVLSFALTEEFRCVEVIAPETLSLGSQDIERLLVRVQQETSHFKAIWEKRWNR